MIHKLSEKKQYMLLEWMEKLEDLNLYVDCILLLSGLGLFWQEISTKEFMKQIKR